VKWWQKGLIGAVIALLIVLGLFVIPIPGDAATPTTTLEWTAPGDDGNVGTAAFYEMRFAATPVGADTLAWWNAATPVAGLPNPQVAGTTQSVVVSSGLQWATTYYFILRATDDGLPQPDGQPVPNTSGWSNVASVAFGPAPDNEPPARVIDLIAR
jgi:hypothetical protein